MPWKCSKYMGCGTWRHGSVVNTEWWVNSRTWWSNRFLPALMILGFYVQEERGLNVKQIRSQYWRTEVLYITLVFEYILYSLRVFILICYWRLSLYHFCWSSSQGIWGHCSNLVDLCPSLASSANVHLGRSWGTSEVKKEKKMLEVNFVLLLTGNRVVLGKESIPPLF